jgi:polyhydroxybutyrate depolymerase
MVAPPTRLVAVVIALLGASSACERWARPGSGTSERRMVVGGVTRTYLLHASGPARPGRALVFVLHGLGGTGAGVEWRTKGTFDTLGDRDGAVVIYPEALGDPRRWNAGWDAPSGAGLSDDLGFFSALIDMAVAELGVDRKRVFAAGFSDGASMVYRLGCERPDLVAAVAPVSGGMSPGVARACAHGGPVSIIGMHGTEDPIAPLEQPIHDGIAAWATRDGCPSVPSSSRLPDLDPHDGTQTRVHLFGPCGAGTSVVFYTIEGGGHAWPGGASVWGFRRRGNTPHDFDAGVAIWDFFLKHARN